MPASEKMGEGSSRKKLGENGQRRKKRHGEWELPLHRGESRRRRAKQGQSGASPHQTSHFSRVQYLLLGAGFLFFYNTMFGKKLNVVAGFPSQRDTTGEAVKFEFSPERHSFVAPAQPIVPRQIPGDHSPPGGGSARHALPLPEQPPPHLGSADNDQGKRVPENEIRDRSRNDAMRDSAEQSDNETLKKEDLKPVEVTANDAPQTEENQDQSTSSSPTSIRTTLVENRQEDTKPLYSWRKTRSAKHLYSMGSKLDRVMSFGPACLNPDTGSIETVDITPACSGFNKSFEAWTRYCNKNEIEFNRESGLKFEKVDFDEMTTRSESSRFVRGVTILQGYSRDSGNIAHFLGRAAWINHLLGNIESYGFTKVDNILLSPNPDVLKRFLFPERYSFWHAGVLGSMVHPNKLDTESSFEAFLDLSREEIRLDETRVHILPDFKTTSTICFETLVVPAFLKGRFFIKDFEYPSELPSFVGQGEGVPSVPRDSLRFRRKINAHLFGSTEIPEMTKTIIFVDRATAWGRRSIAPSSKQKVFDLLERHATKHGFLFRKVMFENNTLKEQVESIHDAAVTVSVHGANLVNSIFMPPLGVVVEIFPFGFNHGMYHEGGGSGLKYYNYTLKNGDDFPDLKKFSSRQACVDESHDCKVHYRDATLDFAEDDLSGFAAVLSSVTEYLHGLRLDK